MGLTINSELTTKEGFKSLNTYIKISEFYMVNEADTTSIDVEGVETITTGKKFQLAVKCFKDKSSRDAGMQSFNIEEIQPTFTVDIKDWSTKPCLEAAYETLKEAMDLHFGEDTVENS